MNDMFRGCNEYEVHKKSIQDLQRELKRVCSLFKPCCMVEDDNYHGTHCDNPAIDRVALDINDYVIKPGQIAIAHFDDGSSRIVFVEGVDLDNPTVNAPGCWVDTIDEDGLTEGLMSYLLEVTYEPVSKPLIDPGTPGSLHKPIIVSGDPQNPHWQDFFGGELEMVYEPVERKAGEEKYEQLVG